QRVGSGGKARGVSRAKRAGGNGGGAGVGVLAGESENTRTRFFKRAGTRDDTGKRAVRCLIESQSRIVENAAGEARRVAPERTARDGRTAGIVVLAGERCRAGQVEDLAGAGDVGRE